MKYITMSACRHRVLEGEMLTVCGQPFDKSKLTAEAGKGVPLCLDCEKYVMQHSVNLKATVVGVSDIPFTIIEEE